MRGPLFAIVLTVGLAGCDADPCGFPFGLVIEGCDASASCTISTWYADADGDGWAGTEERSCPPADASTVADDCDDTDPLVHPLASEVCAPWGIDEDCDGLIDADDPDHVTTTATWFFIDGDGDGYGVGAPERSCGPDGDYVASADGDCDDGDALVNPGATERCNHSDDDCDGSIESGPVATLNGQLSGTDLVSLVAAAEDGALLDVCPGIYDLESTLEVTGRMTVRALGVGSAVLRGDGTLPLLRISAADVVLEGLDLQLGLQGLVAEGADRLVVRDCDINSNGDGAATPALGGGLLLRDTSDFSIDNTTIDSNVAIDGARSSARTVRSSTRTSGTTSRRATAVRCTSATHRTS